MNTKVVKFTIRYNDDEDVYLGINPSDRIDKHVEGLKYTMVVRASMQSRVERALDTCDRVDSYSVTQPRAAQDAEMALFGL